MAYNLRQVNLFIDSPSFGSFAVQGFADGSEISPEYSDDRNVMYRDAKGYGTLVNSNVSDGTVTFTITPQSTTYKTLMSLAKSNEEFGFRLVDGNDLSLCIWHGDNCLFQRVPTDVRGTEMPEIEFVILVPVLIRD